MGNGDTFETCITRTHIVAAKRVALKRHIIEFM